MSVRGRAPPKPARGSIFGRAIGAPRGGFWGALTESPPRTPPLQPTPSSGEAPPPFSLQAGAPIDEEPEHDAAAALGAAVFDAEGRALAVPERAPTAALREIAAALAAEPPARARARAAAAPPPPPAAAPRDAEVPTTFAVFPSHLHDFSEGVLLVTFHQRCTGTAAMQKLQSWPRRLLNEQPVAAIPVGGDALRWAPMHTDEGEEGHVFSLCQDRHEVCKFEATTRRGDGALRRVAVVQASYSPLLVASGFAPPSSLLVYDDPGRHLAQLRRLERDLEGANAELGYVPTAEFVVTPALDRLALEASTEAAERSWTATKRFLRAVSAHAANCIDRYAALEYERVGARELRPKVDGWRSQVV
jgi:hypothetical protein